MINTILMNENLVRLYKERIEENGVAVLIDEEYYDKTGSLSRESIINLSVDEFYNSLREANTPPSPDNLVIINRGGNKYSVYLIELKCVDRVSRLKAGNIKEKFNTAVEDFMKVRFGECFLSGEVKIIDFNIWVVCNRFNFVASDISDEDYLRKIRGGVMESLLLAKPYKFRDRIATIGLMLSGVSLA